VGGDDLTRARHAVGGPHGSPSGRGRARPEVPQNHGDDVTQISRPMPKPTAQVKPYVDILGVDLTVDFLLAFGGRNRPETSCHRQSGARLAQVRAAGMQSGRAATRLLSSARDMQARARASVVAADRLCAALQSGIDDGLTLAASPPARRPNRRAKIANDPELQAFVLARIMSMTFDQVLAEIAATFPENRRVSRAALHRWGHQTGKHIPSPPEGPRDGQG
jgi:hypothetical protein